MNWKLSAAMLVAGMFVLFIFFGGSHTGSASAMVLGESSAGRAGSGPDGTETDRQTDDPDHAENPFAAYTYYQAEYLERYTAYQQGMPELDVETVVWHVNAGLDHAPYMAAAQTEEDHPLVVNKHHQLPDGYEPEELVVIHSTIMATPGTAEAFQRMRAAAMKDGILIEAAGGYRSVEKQKELFETQELYCGTEQAEESVARPGFGEHSTGRALHIVDRNYTFDGFAELPEYAWLAENCAEYGFILRYGEGVSDITGFAHEPYHFTFVGQEIALGMQASDIATLEEYTARGLAPTGGSVIDDRVAVMIALGYSGGAGSPLENDVALRIQQHLYGEDVRVVIAKNSGDIESETKASALIGIQQGDEVQGAVAWFASDEPESRGLADTVRSRLSWAAVDAENRGISDNDRVALTSLTEAPSVLIEIPDGPDDCDRLAKSISDAVVAHLGIRKMFLTFDDGPSAKNTPKVLDILKEKGVKATFFVIGEMAEIHPELLERIAAEGHAIGIHCYRHDYGELYESVKSFTDDFEKARAAVKDITGIEPMIYRFPGGSINHYNQEVYKEIIAEMDRLGFVYFDWNTSVDDALSGVKSGDMMKNVQEYPRQRYAILLMHDAYPHIAEELGDVIDYYSDYQMNVIEDDTSPVHLK